MLLETLVVALTAKIDDFKKNLDAADKEAESWSSGLAGKVTKFAGGAALAGATALAGAVAAIGTSAMNAWSDFDEASDNLINATGASGDALAEMEESVKDLYGSTAGLDASMGDIGKTMGAVSQRTGLTGEDLEALTGQVMNFARMTGVDGVAATEGLTHVMGQFGVDAAQAGTVLNELYGAGQQFGVSFDQLTAQLTKFGQPLQNMGFSLEQSIGMLGQWEQNGVNSQAMLAGLSAASAKFAADGIPMQTGLQGTIAAIQGASSETEALSIAYETFGRKAGAEMVAAIHNGNLSIDAATAAVQGAGSALDSASERVLDFPDAWQMATKQITTALVPLGQSLAELISAILPSLVKIIGFVVDAISPFVDGLITLGKWIAETISGGTALNEKLDALPAPFRAVAAALEHVIGWFKSFGSTVQEMGTGRLAFLKDWVDQNLPRLQMIFQAVLGAIQGFWDTFGGAIMGIVEFVFGTIWTIIDTVFRNIMDMVSAVLAILTGDFEGGFRLILGVVERTATALWGIMQNLVGTIIDAITGIDWIELGSNIIEGIINGILNMSQRLWDAAQSISQSLWDRMTGWWNTGSPSKKAETGLGVPIAQGIAVGLESGIDYGAIDSAMSSVFEGFNVAQPATTSTVTNNSPTFIIQGGDREQVRLGVLDGLRAAGMTTAAS